MTFTIKSGLSVALAWHCYLHQLSGSAVGRLPESVGGFAGSAVADYRINFIFAFVFDNLHTQLLRAGVNFVDNLFVNCTVRRFTYLQFNLPLSLILNWPCSGIILHWKFCVIYVLNFVGAASICGNIFHITRFRYSLVPKGGNSGDKERPPGEAGFCTALVVCL